MAFGYFTTQTSRIDTSDGGTVSANNLYRTDGTAAGTSLVWNTGSSAHLGDTPPTIQLVSVEGDHVFFSMKDTLNNENPLYVSDGTAAGTVKLFAQYYGDATDVGGTLYFGGMEPRDGVRGGSLSLYKTDGTVAGTSLVERDIMGSSGERSIPDFAQAGGKLFFIATFLGTNLTGSTNGTFGSGVWVSDGTQAGTTQLGTASTPDALAAIGGTVYFGKNDSTFDNNAQIWKTNGTQAGTVLVKDLVPGTSGSTDPSPSHLTAVGTTLYFTGSDGSHGIELWKSNGTEAGTTVVEDIRPGKDGSAPTNLTQLGNTLFFIANDGSHGSELWRSNGTEASTYMVKDVGPGGAGGVANLMEAGGLLYFSGYDGSNWQLWRSDGSAAGTYAILDAPADHLTNVGGVLFFSSGDGSQSTLFRTDGTAAGTVPILTQAGITDIIGETAAVTTIDPATSSVPALLVAGLVNGTLPTAEKLDSLTAFAQQQYNYYHDVLHSGSSQLGPYEALGRAFAETAPFQAKFAGGTDSAFIDKAYGDIFGHAPTAAQNASLLSQVTYFEALYQSAGLSPAQADIEARGAVFGQIAGYAALDASQPYKSYADGLLLGFANGDASQYGAVFGV